MLPYQNPTPTATATPTPSPAPTDGENSVRPNAASSVSQMATPQVTIPQGFAQVVDATRGYSLALPRGWQELDLRGERVANMAHLVGQGQAVAQMQAFLSGKQGSFVGIVAATDLTSAMFGGFPTLLNVSVVDAPAATSDDLLLLTQNFIKSNEGLLGRIEIQQIEATYINNLPGLRGTVRLNLAAVGYDVELVAEIAALLANNNVYILTLATPTNKVEKYASVFEQIIGTFRPE